MKPEARSKWLAKAMQQAHPEELGGSLKKAVGEDGRLAPKSIYDIVAHAKFANEVSEKSGQRMW